MVSGVDLGIAQEKRIEMLVFALEEAEKDRDFWREHAGNLGDSLRTALELLRPLTDGSVAWVNFLQTSVGPAQGGYLLPFINRAEELALISRS